MLTMLTDALLLSRIASMSAAGTGVRLWHLADEVVLSVYV
jgi:hypothetical protein